MDETILEIIKDGITIVITCYSKLYYGINNHKRIRVLKNLKN